MLRAEAYSLASIGKVTGFLNPHHSSRCITWGPGLGRRYSTHNNSLFFSQLSQTNRSNAGSMFCLCNLDATGSFLFGWLRKENNKLALLGRCGGCSSVLGLHSLGLSDPFNALSFQSQMQTLPGWSLAGVDHLQQNRAEPLPEANSKKEAEHKGNRDGGWGPGSWNRA